MENSPEDVDASHPEETTLVSLPVIKRKLSFMLPTSEETAVTEPAVTATKAKKTSQKEKKQSLQKSKTTKAVKKSRTIKTASKDGSPVVEETTNDPVDE